MAVTKEVYTATATWTASQLAALFQDAFIDAGLMSAWFDSFVTSGIENRVLQVVYDNSKTYGTCYYWFMFTTTEVRVSVATGWNASTDVPTGTQYVDFFSTASNTTASHAVVASGLATGTTATLTRYTSSSTAAYSWFSFRNGATPVPFFIAPASTTIAPWIDLNKVMFHHFILPSLEVSSASNTSRASIEFRSIYMLRRSYISGGIQRGISSNDPTSYNSYPTCALGYIAPGNESGSYGSNFNISEARAKFVIIPYGFNNSNTAYTTDYLPVINGYSYSNYTNSSMPTDLGMFFNYGVTTFSFGDRVVVTAGTEEWEVYGFANNTNVNSASALLVARVV